MNRTCEHKQHHSDEKKKNMINRLKRIEGQIRGIAKMIDNDVYCDDILNQFSSVESALNGVKKILLEEHMKSCIYSQVKDGNQEAMDEVITTIKKLLK
ncbi:MAG: metal-sensitive transcriptional regulator [Candidatus Marinimicrobia bacterium]|nr:metal-sensitive transcriptional regulator [Candidatus Neomarinimicrobiota bacterium]